MSEAYRRALEEHGLEDVQPRYRKLLLQLKARDVDAYERAVMRYHEEVETAGGEDPLAAWIAYGRWLAGEIAPGALKAIASNGRAEDAGAPPPLGPLLIHLPDDARRRGVVVAMPARPSDAQRETAALLCAS